MEQEKQESRVSRLAIASLVCGILTMTCIGSPLFFLPALISGHLAWNLIKQSKGTLIGKWMAVWGMVCGWGFILLGLVAVVYIVSPPYKTLRTEKIGEYNGCCVFLEEQKISGRDQYRYQLIKTGKDRETSILIEEKTDSSKKPKAGIDNEEIYYESVDGDLLVFSLNER